MKFSLIICTYMRPKALHTLLKSIDEQSIYPDEVLVVDGSLNENTKEVLQNNCFKNVKYYLISEEDRGLTKQRNFGISKVSNDIDVVCFLDDDIILKPSYFENIMETYKLFPNAGGVGGYIMNEVKWREINNEKKINFEEYEIDGYIRNLGSRNVLRKKIGLLSDKPPCIMPEFANGFSVSFLPPSNKVYEVEYFMGGVSSFKKEVVDNIKFSTYFEGYGLYEDADYCLRVSKKYNLYVNTSAQLYHYHESSGRPNQYTYGKMVVRNGWYVWRVKYEKPSLNAKIKWSCITILLLMVRFSNVVSGDSKLKALTESSGRLVALFQLLVNKPKIHQ